MHGTHSTIPFHHCRLPLPAISISGSTVARFTSPQSEVLLSTSTKLLMHGPVCVWHLPHWTRMVEWNSNDPPRSGVGHIWAFMYIWNYTLVLIESHVATFITSIGSFFFQILVLFFSLQRAWYRAIVISCPPSLKDFHANLKYYNGVFSPPTSQDLHQSARCGFSIIGISTPINLFAEQQNQTWISFR